MPCMCSPAPPPPPPPPPSRQLVHILFNLIGLVINFIKKSFCGSFFFSVADFFLSDEVFYRYRYNKRACPTKNEPQQGISYLERERVGVRERGVGRGKRERGVRE
jgi:hypothetical protein